EQIVYRDIVSSRVGFDWVRQIEQAISRSSVILVVIGSRWFAAGSDGTRRIDDPADTLRIEVATAFRQGVKVIPVLIEDVQMPRRDDLPEEIRPVATIQARRLRDEDWDHDVGLLIEDLEQIGMPVVQKRELRGWSK